jgi:hypothetical protein
VQGCRGSAAVRAHNKQATFVRIADLRNAQHAISARLKPPWRRQWHQQWLQYLCPLLRQPFQASCPLFRTATFAITVLASVGECPGSAAVRVRSRQATCVRMACLRNAPHAISVRLKPPWRRQWRQHWLQHLCPLLRQPFQASCPHFRTATFAITVLASVEGCRGSAAVRARSKQVTFARIMCPRNA